jgi:hypothetical protein
MQIHEITIQEGLGWELTKGIGRAARDQFIQKATGVSDPYQKTDMTGYVDPDAPVAAAPTPAATKPPLKPVGFNAANIMQQPSMKKYAEKPKPNYAQTGQVNYKPATVTVNSPAAPKINPAATPQQYTLDGNPLDPKNPIHAKLIAQMQSQGVINATTPTAK